MSGHAVRVPRLATVNDQATGVPDQPTVTVYWRPGCFYCRRLLKGLQRDGVAVDLRNIWEDPQARAFVRRHNHGDETVPTVAVADQVWTNPDPRRVTEAARVTRTAPATDAPRAGDVSRQVPQP